MTRLITFRKASMIFGLVIILIVSLGVKSNNEETEENREEETAADKMVRLLISNPTKNQNQNEKFPSADIQCKIMYQEFLQIIFTVTNNINNEDNLNDLKIFFGEVFRKWEKIAKTGQDSDSYTNFYYYLDTESESIIFFDSKNKDTVKVIHELSKTSIRKMLRIPLSMRVKKLIRIKANKGLVAALAATLHHIISMKTRLKCNDVWLYNPIWDEVIKEYPNNKIVTQLLINIKNIAIGHLTERLKEYLNPQSDFELYPQSVTRLSNEENIRKLLWFDVAWSFGSNLFIGPDPVKRELDPGAAFDSEASNLIESDHFKKLSNINKEMELFIEKYENSHDRKDFEIIFTEGAAIYVMDKLIGIHYVIPAYNPDYWNTDKPNSKAN